MNRVWMDLLDEQGIGWAVLDPAADRASAEALGRRSDWSVAFADRDMLLLCRIGAVSHTRPAAVQHNAVDELRLAGVEDDTCSTQAFGVKGRG